tara:strand:- start:574 stop:957 length:384 start_codon:yes stop_codon:yes gene_type:complete
MDKKLICKAFNEHFMEFMEDILILFPKELDLLTGHTFFKKVIKYKSRALIEYWYSYIYVKYAKEIECGNFEFFIKKDYSDDIGNSNNKVLNKIEKMRSKVSNVSNTNKGKIVGYVRNLSKLSYVYYN